MKIRKSEFAKFLEDLMKLETMGVKNLQLIHQSVNDSPRQRVSTLRQSAEFTGQSHFRLSRSCIRFSSMAEIIERSAFLGREGDVLSKRFWRNYRSSKYSA